MWILVWVVLSVILIAVTLWSLQILLRQKKAWESYAKKKGLSFRKGTFMGPAEINGNIGEYSVAFFTAERQEPDMRRTRYVTAIEIGLKEGVIAGGVAGTGEMLTFMQTLAKLHPYKVEGWDPGHHIFVIDDAVANAYFTPERLEAYEGFLKTRNADAIVVFSDTELILRLETSDPMQDSDKMDKIMTRILSLAEKMRVTPEERKAYAALAKTPEE